MTEEEPYIQVEGGPGKNASYENSHKGNMISFRHIASNDKGVQAGVDYSFQINCPCDLCRTTMVGLLEEVKWNLYQVFNEARKNLKDKAEEKNDSTNSS